MPRLSQNTENIKAGDRSIKAFFFNPKPNVYASGMG